VPRQTISVKHNIEMAHRLYLTPGKCEQIHGHSWWVTLEMVGIVDDHGLLSGLNFSTIKRLFRRHLDSTYDHQLLLNSNDPWAGKLHIQDTEGWTRLPGLTTFMGDDPTTENLAEAIASWACLEFERPVSISVWETSVNNATWSNLA
jgi:6-pyruvoyltetrahydropterin/6-carboxytetrahydropterin synthase